MLSTASVYVVQLGLGRETQGGGGGLLGVTTEGTIVTLRGSAVGGSLGNLGEGAGKSGWRATGGTGRGAMGARAVGGMAVTLEKMRENVWMA